MVHDRLLWSKSCKAQQPNKSYVDGVLAVYPDACTWTPSTLDAAPAFRLLLADVSGQKKAKGKPLLQLQTVTNARIILEFASEEEREGASTTIADAKAQLPSTSAPSAAAADAAPAGGGGAAAAGGPGAAAEGRRGGSGGGGVAALIPGEVEKQALLAADEDLRQLYTSLVPTRTLTEAEFWRSVVASSGAGAAAAAAASQRPGIANAVKALLPLQQEGRGHQVGVTLSEEVRAAILAERPHVRRAFLANVPHNMGEREFWERYVKHYLAKQAARYKRTAARARGADAAPPADPSGIFTDDGSADDRARAAAKRRCGDSTLDLDAQQGDAMSDSYGLVHQPFKDETVSAKRYGGPSQELIAEINAHAHYVVQGPDGSSGKGVGDAAPRPSQRPPAPAAEGQAPEPPPAPGAPPLEDLVDAPEVKFETLRITTPRTYFEGPLPPGAGGGTPPRTAGGASALRRQGSAAAGGNGALPGAAAAPPPARMRSGEEAAELLATVDPVSISGDCFFPRAMHQVLMECSGAGEGGSGVDAQGRPLRSPALALPQRRQQELRSHALVVNELLRHLWGCIPANSEPKRDKIQRVQAALISQYDAVKGAMDSCAIAERAHVVQLLKPLLEQMDKGIEAAEEVKKAMARRQSGVPPGALAQAQAAAVG